jgi:hypothetical protein
MRFLCLAATALGLLVLDTSTSGHVDPSFRLQNKAFCRPAPQHRDTDRGRATVSKESSLYCSKTPITGTRNMYGLPITGTRNMGFRLRGQEIWAFDHGDKKYGLSIQWLWVLKLCTQTDHHVFSGWHWDESYRTSRPNGQYTCFVFGRSRVQISSRRPAILTEVFRGFPQSLDANSGIVS